MSSKRRITVRLDDEAAKVLDRAYVSTGRAKNDLINSAIVEHYQPSDDTDNWAIMFRRLNRQRNAFENLNQRVGVLSEMLLLFVQYYFAHTPAPADESREEVKTLALSRYQKFENALMRTIQEGGLLTEQIYRSLQANDEEPALAMDNDPPLPDSEDTIHGSGEVHGLPHRYDDIYESFNELGRLMDEWNVPDGRLQAERFALRLYQAGVLDTAEHMAAKDGAQNVPK